MLTLSAKIRKELGKKVKALRKNDIIPAILYGPEVENLALSINLREFEKIYDEAGESSIVKLNIEGGLPHKSKTSKEESKSEDILVLIKEATRDAISDKFLHVDFYQPKLKEKVEVTVPLVFEGEAPAVKEFGGVLVKNISEIEVKALPQDLPKEIRIDVSVLKTFEDSIEIKDIKLPPGVEVEKESDEVVALVTPPQKEEVVIAKPIAEEKTEEVENGKGGEEENQEKSN